MNAIIPIFRLFVENLATVSEERIRTLNPDRFGFTNSLATKSYFKDPFK